MTDPESWRGAVFLGSGWLLYAGPIGAASSHRHRAVQVVVARGSSATLVAADGSECRGVAVQVESNRPHAMPHALASGYLLYVEPDSTTNSRVATPSVGMQAWARADLESVLSAPEPTSLEGALVVARGIVDLVKFATPPRPYPRDPSVRKALAKVPSLIAELGSELRLSTIAGAVGRSPSRFARALNEELGMSVPAYVRWARLLFVARSMAEGRTLTEAAQSAGFSDSAHLSRVFRETFGVRPSALATCTRWILGDVELG